MDNNYRYPIVLDLSGQRVLVVGGGKVAVRKVRSLLAAGAELHVIAPELHDDMPLQEINYTKRVYEKEDLAKIRPVLCMAATDVIEINRTVVETCREAGVFVNVADNSAKSDFLVQANFERGDLMVSISTNGKSPGFSRQLRQYLEEIIDPLYGEALEISALLRQEILKLPIPQEARAELLRQIHIDRLHNLLEENSKAAVIERMRGCLFSS